MAGGALIRGMKERLQNSIHLPVDLDEEPSVSVSKGISQALCDPKKLQSVLFLSCQSNIMKPWMWLMSTALFIGCQEDNENSKKVCDNFQTCILGTWDIEVNTVVNGTLAPFGGTPGSVTFNSNKTGRSTGNIFQSYASGNYYNSFTYETDNSKYTLKVLFDIPLSNPTQSQLFTVKYAYENEINMETPMIGGMINVTLKK